MSIHITASGEVINITRPSLSSVLMNDGYIIRIDMAGKHHLECHSRMLVFIIDLVVAISIAVACEQAQAAMRTKANKGSDHKHE